MTHYNIFIFFSFFAIPPYLKLDRHHPHSYNNMVAHTFAIAPLVSGFRSFVRALRVRPWNDRRFALYAIAGHYNRARCESGGRDAGESSHASGYLYRSSSEPRDELEVKQTSIRPNAVDLCVRLIRIYARDTKWAKRTIPAAARLLYTMRLCTQICILWTIYLIRLYIHTPLGRPLLLLCGSLENISSVFRDYTRVFLFVTFFRTQTDTHIHTDPDTHCGSI